MDWAAWSAIAVAALALIGESLHAVRCRRIGMLAFGPSGRPAHWVRLVPLLRTLGFGAVTWGLVSLLTIDPKVHVSDAVADEDYRHLLVVLDVSPSMQLKDAGPSQKQTRAARARDVLDSLFSRVSVGHYRVSVVAVYNGAKPVVIDTEDMEVVRNILTDLPMHFAFTPGKTKLLEGIGEAARIAKPWDPRSTIMVLISDGDTVPPTGMPELPPSIQSVLVVGVGDPLAGTFIDGRQSRQDVSALRQIALRLGGTFHNGNQQQLSSEAIRRASEKAASSEPEPLTRREYALILTVVGSALLALIPLLLHAFGTFWQPGVPQRHGASVGDGAKSLSTRQTRLGQKAAANR